MSSSTSPNARSQDDAEILEFLDRHEHKELLRFVTIGSVDDGKSTLIGRLLYESGGVFTDQLAAITTRDASGKEVVNFANLTDGLVAEREQGITIDVAYRYTTTERRKFIIADTPGHVQYTRNMATGASTADAAIILIDARLGVLQQTRRHAYIANLLGIPYLLVAVNKMDTVGFDEATFRKIQGDLAGFLEGLSFQAVRWFPVSALEGDNVVQRSTRTAWWDGQPLLETLETLPIPTWNVDDAAVLPVQYVLRPDMHYRGFAGALAAGVIRPGDEVKVLPSGKRSVVKSVDFAGRSLQEAFAPMSVAVTLRDEIDISRGDVITTPENDLSISRVVDADVVWLSETPLEVGRQYLVKHTSNLVAGAITDISHRIDMDTLEAVPCRTLELNDVARVRFVLNRPLVLADYGKNRTMGAFIVIDRITNATVGAGMIRGHGEDYQQDSREVAAALGAEERAARFHQKPAVLWLTGRPGSGKIVVARALERRLFDAGHHPFVLDPDRYAKVTRNARGAEIDGLLDVADVLAEAGLLVIIAFTGPARADRQRARERFGERATFLEVAFEADSATCRSRLSALGRDPTEADVAYEAPEDPDLAVDGDELDTRLQVDRILRAMERRGLLGQ
jgi:bifunctional enzyme CysN/CysC